MNNRTNGKECYKCCYYRALYFKGANSIDSAKCGKCTIGGKINDFKIVKNNETCVHWRKRDKRDFTLKKKIAKTALNDILNELSMMRQIFEEDRKPNNE